MDYKQSRYNVRFTRDGSHYLWNTLSGALIKLDQKGVAYLDKGKLERNETYLETLRANGCIVESGRDEFREVIEAERATMQDDHPKVLHYTIAPGLSCNYDCWYCFERGRASHAAMSQEVVEATIRHILTTAESCDGLRNLGITWFGGEPLLYLEQIEELSGELIAWCDAHKVTYGAGIVTNGRLLTEDVARRLKACRVGYVQLAIDGTASKYAKAKGASRDDFEQTVRNVEASCALLPITIRINLKDDLDDAIALTDYLLEARGLDGKIKIYVARMRDYGWQSAAAERADHARWLALEGAYQRLFAGGGRYSAKSLAFNVAKRRQTTCLSVCGPDVCLGPEGEAYRCEHHFGRPEYRVGNIMDSDGLTFRNAYLEVPHLEACKRCDIFPICMGGCKNDSARGEVTLACADMRERFIDNLMLANKLRS